NPFRYIIIRKINAKKLGRGLHCLDSKAYPIETSKWIVGNNLRSYHHDIFDISFITLFPWITTKDSDGNLATVLTLDILNSHPYMLAEVNISYVSEAEGGLTEKTYNIAPYTLSRISISRNSK
ncbi:hypothetical protein LOAG_14385, partial [Loa loa]